MTITVLLADHDPDQRTAYATLLDAEPDIETIAECDDGAAAVRLTSRLRPDIVLLDVQLPGMSGIEATRRITSDPGLAAVRVVALAERAADSHVFGALSAGARGFVLKDADPGELLRAVRAAADGQALLSSRIVRRVIDACLVRPCIRPPAPGLDGLTRREREVLTLIGTGLSNQEIASKLVVSCTTAKTHASRTMAKLGARNRTELVAIAYESGLVTRRSALPH